MFWKKLRSDADFREEIRSHIDIEIERLVSEGMSREQAHAAAHRAFGNVTAAQERFYESRRLPSWDGLKRDFRYAIRQTFKRPLFTAAIVLTLGVCIGAVTAVFSIVDAALLRPLPYPRPEQLAQLVVRFHSDAGVGLQQSQNGAAWEQFSQSMKTLDLAVYRQSTENLNFSSSGQAGYIRQQRIGAGFFRVFGIAPFIGREFTPEEDVPNGPAVAILSYNLWRNAFGSDSGIVGRRVTIAGLEYRIAGVAAEFESQTDIWTPLRPSTRGEGQGFNYVVVGRLRPGVTWAQADTEAASTGEVIIQQRRIRPGATAVYSLMSLQEAATGSLAPSLWMVFGVTILLLIVGCVNIAGMLMAQGISRRSKIATRMAIGASRSTIIFQLLSESLFVALTAAVAGVFIGYVSLETIKEILPPAFSVLQDARLDLRVLSAVGFVSLLTSILFGLLPALQAGRVDIRTAQSNRTATDSSGVFTRRVLSIIQIAVTVTVLIVAGLLIRSFTYLSNLEPGVDATNVITANFALLDARYSSPRNAYRYFNDVLGRLLQLPGVEGAAVAHSLPYERGWNTTVARRHDSQDGPSGLTNYSYISPQFFQVLRIPVLRGRALGEDDRPDAAPVVVINDAFAKMYFKDAEAVGSQLRVFGQEREIVGIVGDVLQQSGWGNFGPIGNVPIVYLPVAQPGAAGLSAPSPSWLVRTSAQGAATQRQIEDAVKSVDPLLPIASFRSLSEINRRALGLQHFLATLLEIAAGLSLLLACIGTFAMISNSVAARSREFGIRLALGSSVTRAVRNCAMPGIICAAVGLMCGLGLARAGTRFLQGMLFGVTPLDQLTYWSVGAGVLIIAAAASLVPALRITKLDPAQTLRHE